MPAIEHVDQRSWPFDCVKIECWFHLDRDLADDAKRSKTHSSNMEKFGILLSAAVDNLAGCGHHSHSPDLGGDTGERQACSVGTGADGPRERLIRDVAQVGHGQANFGQSVVQVPKLDASLNGHQSAATADRPHHVQVFERNQHVVGTGDRGEAVTRAYRSHPTACGRCLLHDRLELSLAQRPFDVVGRAVLIASPVLPRGIRCRPETAHTPHQCLKSTGHSVAAPSSMNHMRSCFAIVGSTWAGASRT